MSDDLFYATARGDVTQRFKVYQFIFISPICENNLFEMKCVKAPPRFSVFDNM